MNTATSRFDLTKATETFDRFLLEKGVNQAPTMRVALAVDISGSMDGIIRRGDLQLAVNQIVPVGLKFDDNGEVDVFKFNTSCREVDSLNKNNFEDFVSKKGVSAGGGTSYAPIISTVVKKYFGGGGFMGMGKKDNTPALVLIITDGECDDAGATERALQDAQKHPIYFHFVAVGSAQFRTIKRLADALPNVGDVYLRDFGMSEEQVYAQVVCDELVTWIKQR